MTATMWMPTARMTQDLATQRLFGYSEAQLEQIAALKAAQYFLIKNDGGTTGERFPCGRCGCLHAYWTQACTERPYAGLTDALYAYTRAINPRSETAQTLFQAIPDLATGHPETARARAPRDGYGMDVLGVALGLTEPITEQQARIFCLRISLKGERPPYVFR